MLAHAQHIESVTLGSGRDHPGRIGLVGKRRHYRKLEPAHDSTLASVGPWCNPAGLL
jgi:hypothetical protein